MLRIENGFSPAALLKVGDYIELRGKTFEVTKLTKGKGAIGNGTGNLVNSIRIDLEGTQHIEAAPNELFTLKSKP